jgi:hypothetical protein
VRTQGRAGSPPLCHAFGYKRTAVDAENSGVSAAAPAVAQEAGRDSFCKSVAARPNPSLKLTRYGRRRKAGPQHMVHHCVPALRRPPPRAA